MPVPTSSDFEAAADGGAADPIVVIDATICAAEIDGTDTAVSPVGALPSATADGIVPAGWVALGTAPDFATLLTYWGLTGLPVDGEDEPVAATVLVVNLGVVVTLDPAALDAPWEVVPASTVVRLAGSRVALRADLIDGDVLYLSGSSLPYDGYGVLDGADDVEGALDTGESALDRPWWETGWSLTENVNLAGLLGPSAPGSQPTLEYGAVVTGEDNNCDVLLLGQTAPYENGVYTVDKTTGVWARQGASTAFWPPGNGAVHTLNAPGEEGDGWMLRWTDDVAWKRQRGVSGAGSYLYPSDTGRFHLFKPDAVLGPFPTQAHPSP